jgi:ribonuclease P protein subunit RPR2
MGERRPRRGRRSRDTAEIASERIAILFCQAEEAARANEPCLSDRYVALARSIGMRYNVRLSPEQKQRFCHSCGAFLVPGRNLRVRLRPGNTVRTCLKCDSPSRKRLAPRKRA